MSEHSQYVILMKNSTASMNKSLLGKCDFKALYARSFKMQDANSSRHNASGATQDFPSGILTKIYGKTTASSPTQIDESTIAQYFQITKNQRFTDITS